MKILAIRLKNLASLAGEHTLDFSQGPLHESGLFAITGPTGAGKSTLLDALCLALFGNTPRLRNAPTRDSQTPDVEGEQLVTADPRTLLRRGTAAGFAEVDFVGRDGDHYRARWSVRRARNRPEGRLQASEQALIALPDERILASQKREFDRLLPDKLGLTFEQFTRAVLLAQSEFSAFLQADDNARSELLEKLTDTGIYSRISVAAYQRTRQASDEIKRLESRLEGELPASAEQRQAMEADAEQAEQTWQTVQAQADALKTRRAWLEQEHQLRDSWQQAVTARQRAEEAHAALADQRTRLIQLDALAPQAHRFLRQRELKRELAALLDQLERTRHSLDQAERQQRDGQTAFDAAQRRASQAYEARQQAQPLLDEASRHAQRLDDLTGDIDVQQRERQQLERQLNDTQHALAVKRDEHSRSQTELQRLEGRLGEHGALAQHRQALQQAEDQARQQLMAWEETRHAWQHWQRLTTQQSALEAQQQQDRQAQATTTAEGRDARLRLEQAEQQAQRVRESIERLRAVRSESVEKLRAQLQADAPCPVCGSLEHPYRHRPPASPAQEMLERTEREEERQLAEASERLEAAREAHQTLTARYRTLQTQLTQRQEQLDVAVRATADAYRPLDALPAGRELLAQDEAQRADWLESQLLLARRQRDERQQALQQFDQDQQRLTPLRETLTRLTVEIGKLDSQAQHQQQRLDHIDASLTPRLAERDTLHRTLSERLGDYANVAQWRDALERDATDAEKRLSDARTVLDGARQAHQRLRLELEHGATQEATLRRELESLGNALQAWRDAHPTISDATLEQLLSMDDAAQSALRTRLQQADQALRDSQLRTQERLTTLQEHRRSQFDTALCDDPEACLTHIEALAAALEEEETELAPRQQQTQQQRDDTLHLLRDDDRRRRAMRALQTELDAARAEQRRWGKLSALIGSADGKAFRRIAQAYNLERLLEHANTHLAGLSRRYRLVRGGSPLGLLVIDTDMGDEQRSVHSLSGGETFLVSLALALGLASMASGRLKIESLFIDEGFGSLDPQSLALAMEALDGLQAQGRKVGVISHVQEMHERIPVRICVEPAGNGASRLSIAQGQA
ncbi:AAA family ATPase [Halomonas sp. McH1-25]|uniref:AAA family ATPase n=1 Tax=unclassified Halomonas TaxID=2609666 RepID=UPI001EF630BB|nr:MULTISPECIES: AAA family ATPase [unclassified Halomonas]MCG7601064.1 AAA family ATPase [Halomonas sp. McH1-25]MCP1361228.1 AAA family ATPase [Halomonas sp. BBD45]